VTIIFSKLLYCRGSVVLFDELGLAWVAAWRAIEMLEPTDKVSFGLMSE